MAVKLTKDGEVDKRTKEYKDSQKRNFVGGNSLSILSIGYID
jgi:hypothetical protein